MQRVVWKNRPRGVVALLASSQCVLRGDFDDRSSRLMQRFDQIDNRNKNLHSLDSIVSLIKTQISSLQNRLKYIDEQPGSASPKPPASPAAPPAQTAPEARRLPAPAPPPGMVGHRGPGCAAPVVPTAISTPEGDNAHDMAIMDWVSDMRQPRATSLSPVIRPPGYRLGLAGSC